MFLIRFGVLVIIGIMLLPRGPAEIDDGRRGASLERNSGLGGFCDRYPKTCDASVELATAFQQKLFYGISLARQSLESRPYTLDDRAKTDGRFGEFRPVERDNDRFVNNNSRERSGPAGEWRGGSN